MNKGYVENIQKLFKYYKSLGDKSLDQLDNNEIHQRFSPESNSMWIVVKHIAGNMRSRWTNFWTEDGEKEWRNRDTEFHDNQVNKDELLKVWNEAWNVLFGILDPLSPEDMERHITIRSEKHTAYEAINRQLGHYAYHIGQMVFIAKAIKDQEWESLSIPKGKSDQFNASMNHLQK
ncbi:MAG: DUF1572 domain-containing protein [Flavobacteriales bacterium]|nr:DUF1572 domain-containing protein [Flavobacteriales bacterium]